MSEQARHELLVRIGTEATQKFSVHDWTMVINKDQALEWEVAEDLDRRLGSVIPPMEPWDSLDDYFAIFMQNEGDDWAETVFASEAFLEHHARSLLGLVMDIYQEAHGPLALVPWENPDGEQAFTIEDTKMFISAWQDEVLTNLERQVVLPIPSPKSLLP